MIMPLRNQLILTSQREIDSETRKYWLVDSMPLEKSATSLAILPLVIV